MSKEKSSAPLLKTDLAYFRQRQRNRVFSAVAFFFSEKNKGSNLTKKDLAAALGKDPAQITRWFAGPGNWELDTISDLLLAMGAEMQFHIKKLDANDSARCEPIVLDSRKDKTLTATTSATNFIDIEQLNIRNG